MRYAFETFPNPHCMGLHIEIKVPSISWISSKEEDPAAQKLKEALLAIRGVQEVFATGYRITITRGGVFTWEELQPKILAVIQKQLMDPDDDFEETTAYPPVALTKSAEEAIPTFE